MPANAGLSEADVLVNRDSRQHVGIFHDFFSLVYLFYIAQQVLARIG
jgi:hypothetical protein